MSNTIPVNATDTGAAVPDARSSPSPLSRTSPASTRLGEELPIFCEKCGYSLFGLGQLRCERCEILHFHCPECGHRQPINTLRPAAQRVIGRIRALWLVWSVFFRLNVIGWSLFGWFIAGYEYTFTYSGIDWDDLIGVAFWGFVFGSLSRMMLLRWSRHWLVGLCMGGLTFTAMILGMSYRFSYPSFYGSRAPGSGVFDAIPFYVFGAFAVVGGAVAIWYIWIGLVHAFLPRSTATMLLNWQRTLSQPAPSSSPSE